MLFNKQDLQDMVYGDHDDGLFTIIGKEITGTSRWSVNYRMVFKNLLNNKFYQTHYSVGATEYQDESPYEYEGDQIECEEVRPVKKAVTVYEVV